MFGIIERIPIIGIILKLILKLVWMVALFPVVALSWVMSKCDFLRIPVGIIGFPFALIAGLWTHFLVPPSIEIKRMRAMLVASYPYTYEFYMFLLGKDFALSKNASANLFALIALFSKDKMDEQVIDTLINREIDVTGFPKFWKIP